MKQTLPAKVIFAIVFIGFMTVGNPLVAQEPIGGPYTVDQHTRLLLHFDGNFKNESPMSADAEPHGKYYFIPNTALGLGQCLRLDNGSITDSSYVTVADNDNLDLTGDWTIEGWLNIFTFGDVAGEWRWVPRLIIKPGDDVFWHPNYWVEMWGDNRLFHTGYYCKKYDSFISNSSANNVFAPGKWVHLTFIRDTQNKLIIQMVHDDQKKLIDFQARGYDPALADPPNTTAQDVHIGWAGSKKIASPSNDSWLDGFVDEIRISDVVRNFEIPPAITDVTALPNQPSTVSSYEIQAKILKIGAAGTITEAKLHYNLGAGWLEVPMTAIGNNFFKGVIPGQPLGSIIRYYVSAKDNAGYRTTNPATAEAAVNPSYFTFAVFEANTMTLSLDFEEGSGVPKDGSAYKNPVKIVGTPSYSNDAVVGSKSLYLPGDSTRLEVDSPFLSSSEFTLDFWMKPDTLVEYTRMIIRPLTWDNWGAMNYAIRFESNTGIISARFEQQAGGNNAIVLDSLVKVGRWYHVIYEVSKDSAVFQLSDKTGRVIDKKGNKVVSPPITPMAPLRIGNAHNISVAGWEKRTYKGLIDGFKLYNYPAAGLTTGIKEKSDAPLPKDFALEQNYPNPFNPVTEIIFAVPKTEKVSLVIYDMLGRKVKTLVDKQVQPGVYSVLWDGTDDSGVKVATGVYLYRLQAKNYHQARKMVLIK